MIAHSMKSKERPWALTKEGPIHEAKKTMKAKVPKRRKTKEIIIKKRIPARPEDMQQEEGSWLGQRICSKKNQHQGLRILMCPFEALIRGPWLTHVKTKMYVQISSKKKLLKIQQN